jgi:hypothetical protein
MFAPNVSVLTFLMQNFTPRIHISEEDFAIITRNGELLDEEGHLGFLEFEHVMRSQIKLFVQRQLSNTLTTGSCSAVEVGTYIYKFIQCNHCCWPLLLMVCGPAGVTTFYAKDSLA